MNLTPLEIAKAPKTPSDRFWELPWSNDKLVQAAVAENPNSPPELLKQLFINYPDEVLNNPILELILLELPDFIEQLYQENFSFFC